MEVRELSFVLFVIVIFWIVCTGSSQCPDVASTVGTKFLFGVMGFQSYFNSSDMLNIHITTMANTTAKVRIMSPFHSFDKNISISNKVIVSMNESHMQMEHGSQFKGIEVISDTNISVAVFLAYGHTEGFQALPLEALSTRYVAASYPPYSGFKSEVLVTGIENNTDILIKYTTKENSDNAVTANLQKYETFQVAEDYDLSGATITSNKPVAVISGSSLVKIPVNQGDIEYIVEQMIPTKYWNRQFVVPSIYPHNFYLVRVFADEDSTEILFYNSTNRFAQNMNQGSHIEIMFGSDPTVIISNNPINVVQYCMDNENMTGNPYMTTVQGLGQFVDRYKFVTQQYIYTTSTIAITVHKNDASGLVLNDKTISSWNTKTVPVQHPMDDYVVIFVSIPSNALFELRHTSRITFGATLFGLLATFAAYGYPLQRSFSNAECLPEFVPTTTASLIGNGTWCFQCEDMSHLQFCDKVTRCNSNEVCYIQRYTTSQSFHMFRSGCMNINKCQSREIQADCQQCCQGNFCNVAGCGEEGLPDSRGPFCFDCPHHGQDEFCQSVHMCRPDQVCKIEKYEWGIGYHYVMGCANQQVCHSKRDIHNTQARNAPVCSKCCQSDFCNMNCTTPHPQQIIG